MTDKITIKGTAPKFDEQELKQYQVERHAEYHSSQESHIHVFAEFLYDLINKVIELTNQGYILSNKYPITSGELKHHCFMRKPNHLIQEDLEAINVQVKQSYVAWLESEHERYRQLLTEQLLQSAKLKEQKKEEEKQAKLLKEIEKEVADTFGELVIPD